MKIILLALSMGIAAAAAGQTTVCGTADIPKGWAAVSTGPACTGSASPLSFNIQRIDTLPGGTIMQACGLGRLPDGWATVSWGAECGRAGSAVVYSRTIENLNGMANGTTVTVCACAPVPDGWTSVSEGGAACGTVGGDTFRSRTIRKN